MNPISGEFVHEVQRLAVTLPAEWLDRLAEVLEASDTADWAYLRAKVARAVPQPVFQHEVQALLTLWESAPTGISGPALALALRAASATRAHLAAQQTLSLVWTGPNSRAVPVRRTDEALLQVIESARQRLLIVSFAVYKVDRIGRALLDAARRGVVIRICLETPQASEGKITFDTLQALGADVVQQSRLYIWPADQRAQTADGRHGSLHAKVAVADGARLLLSSANLTEYAMTLNMELGLLLAGGDAPGQVEQLFDQLIADGVLRSL